LKFNIRLAPIIKVYPVCGLLPFRYFFPFTSNRPHPLTLTFRRFPEACSISLLYLIFPIPDEWSLRYNLIARFLSWQSFGSIIVTGLHDKDAVVNTDGLERAEALGKCVI